MWGKHPFSIVASTLYFIMMRIDRADTGTTRRKAFDEMVEDDCAPGLMEMKVRDDLSWADKQKKIADYIEAVGGFDWTRLKTVCPLCGDRSARHHFIVLDGLPKKVCSPCNTCLELLDDFYIDICNPCERVDFYHKKKLNKDFKRKLERYNSKERSIVQSKYDVILDDCQTCFIQTDLGKKLKIYNSGRM